jgi:hypothetical protein
MPFRAKQSLLVKAWWVLSNNMFPIEYVEVFNVLTREVF